jgi:epoxyqueuosine reductase
LTDPAAIKTALAEQARARGFDAFGVASPDAAPELKTRLDSFLADGAHGDMTWLADTAARRASPLVLWPDVRSIIMLGMNYGPDTDPLAILAAPERAAISVYAKGDDYHELIKARLKELARWLTSNAGGDVKVFVDTAAVMEKPIAERAGLGWQGKHTNVVSRQYGSWLFLGAIFTTLDLPLDNAEPDNCGSCRACLDICPTAAFPAPYKLDARRCISYLTIELAGSIPLEFRRAIGNRIYGCDDCQLVCPWNKFARPTAEKDFAVRHGLDRAQLIELFAWSEADFLQRTRGSAIGRIGHERWLRNIAVALGNGPATPDVIAALRGRLDHPSELVREHVQWALTRLEAAAVTAVPG